MSEYYLPTPFFSVPARERIDTIVYGEIGLRASVEASRTVVQGKSRETRRKPNKTPSNVVKLASRV
jgi:hypothetical protein